MIAVPPDLAAAIKTEVDFHQIPAVDQPWTAPKTVPVHWPAIAQQKLDDHCELFRMATERELAGWLAEAGLQVSPHLSAEEIMARVTAFSGMLCQYDPVPAALLTPQMLIRFCKELEYVPTIATFCRFIDPLAKPIRETVARLKLIAEAGEP